MLATVDVPTAPSTAFARCTGCHLWERGFEAANLGTAQAKRMAPILHGVPRTKGLRFTLGALQGFGVFTGIVINRAVPKLRDEGPGVLDRHVFQRRGQRHEKLILADRSGAV